MSYTGTAVSAGVVIGKVYLYERFVPEISREPADAPDREYAHYLAAREGAQRELETLCRRFSDAGDEEKAAIFGAHLEILSDETMEEEIQAGISGGADSGPWTIHSVYEQYAAMFEQLADPDHPGAGRGSAGRMRPLAALLGRACGAGSVCAAGACDRRRPRPGPVGHGHAGPGACPGHHHRGRRQHLPQRHHRPQL